MKTESCCDKPPRILNKEVTDEIGENLCILFAVYKTGKICRIYPYGTTPSTLQSMSNEDATTSLVIDTRIPRIEGYPEENFKDKFLAFFKLRTAPRSARRCCKIGGGDTSCD